MNNKKISGSFCAASFLIALVFTVNSLLGSFPPARASGPEPAMPTEITAPATMPPETTVPPETVSPGPSLTYLACEAIAKDMDAGRILVYDATAEEMLFCSTDPMDRMFPASISKLYAALVALMYLEPEWVVPPGMS